jgi:hypothetical protein
MISLPRLEIVTVTNNLLAYRETLSREQQDLLDEAQVRSTTQILSDSRTRQHVSTIPRSLPTVIPVSWNRYANSHDKITKRMMTSTEVAVQEADKAEAIQKKVEKDLQRTAVEAAKVAVETAIDNELLAGMASDSDSDVSVEPTEIVFSTLISPPRGMLPPPRPITPGAEAARKRSFTLVHRTPEKPREAPVAPTTPSNTIRREASPVAITTPAPAEIPASTAPARLDGRERRAGKNAAYLEAIAIERGLGRGPRGRGGQA